MNPTRWRKVEEVVEGALRYAPPERFAFIVEACGGDASLREEVESLLAHDEAAGDFLEHSPLNANMKHCDPDAQTSLIGQIFGSYEIIAELGRGGMGTVYLARDIELGRKVALKLLPEHLIGDEERVRRFRHEARAASALNHPNILTVHGFGHVGQIFFLATEFIDGQTLRERMASSLALDGALDVLLEVARALDAAHAAGLVHRDIKPENIMIRRDGYVKVLDFGLAKLIERRDADPTGATAFRTQTGLVMGTPNYMSPEHLRGEGVDGRSDIWSLGVVIYEIVAALTSGNGLLATQSLDWEIERTSSLQANGEAAVADLRRVALKAMARDKEARYQTAQDLMTDLIAIKRSSNFSDDARHSATDDRRRTQETDGGTTLTGRLRNARTASTLKQIINTPVVHKASAFVLLLIASFSIFYWRSAPATERTPTTPANSIEFTRLAVTDQISECVISPDGKYVATVEESADKQSISIRQVAAPGSKQIIVPPRARYGGLTFSPDGNYVYFLSSVENETGLFRVPTLGGTPRKLLSDVHTPVTFSPDGKLLAFVRRKAGATTLIIADADGAGERDIATRTGRSVFGTSGALYQRPAWSPDGKVIICPTSSQAGSLEMNLVEVDVANGAAKQFHTRPYYIIGQVAWLSDAGLCL